MSTIRCDTRQKLCLEWQRRKALREQTGHPLALPRRAKEGLPKEMTFQLDLKDAFAHTHKENGLCGQQEQPGREKGQEMFWNCEDWSLEDLLQHQGLLPRAVRELPGSQSK